MTRGLNPVDRLGAVIWRPRPGITTVACLAVLMLCGPAAAQSISGEWIDAESQIVQVSKSGSEYRGHFRTGPNNGRLALEVRATGAGGYRGQRIVYAGGPRVHHVSVRLSGGGLELKSCTGPDRRPRCMTETWRRELRRPSPLPPVIRDGIRKPAPPPVILRPDIRQQRIGG